MSNNRILAIIHACNARAPVITALVGVPACIFAINVVLVVGYACVDVAGCSDADRAADRADVAAAAAAEAAKEAAAKEAADADAAAAKLVDEAKAEQVRVQEEAKKPASQKRAEAAQEKKRLTEELKADCATRIEKSVATASSSRKGVVNPWSAGGTPFTDIEVKVEYRIDGIDFTTCVAKVDGEKIPLDWQVAVGEGTLRVYLGDNEKNFTVEDRWGRKYTKTAYFTGVFTKKKLENMSDITKAVAGDSGDSLPMLEVTKPTLDD